MPAQLLCYGACMLLIPYAIQGRTQRGYKVFLKFTNTLLWHHYWYYRTTFWRHDSLIYLGTSMITKLCCHKTVNFDIHKTYVWRYQLENYNKFKNKRRVWYTSRCTPCIAVLCWNSSVVNTLRIFEENKYFFDLKSLSATLHAQLHVSAVFHTKKRGSE